MFKQDKPTISNNYLLSSNRILFSTRYVITLCINQVERRKLSAFTFRPGGKYSLSTRVNVTFHPGECQYAFCHIWAYFL